MKRTTPLLLLTLLIGCMGPWLKVDGPYQDGLGRFAVEPPRGWMRQNTYQHLLVTRDGILLQTITIKRFGIDIDFKYTKKKLSKEMLPMEAAEIVIDDIRSNPALLNFELLENSPRTMDGKQGLKLLFTFKNRDGLKFKNLYCGLLFGDGYYVIRYMAPERYYYDKDIRQFEAVLSSFKLTDPENQNPDSTTSDTGEHRFPL